MSSSVFLLSSCPAALQERLDKEIQRQAVAQGASTETDGPASANDVSGVPGSEQDGGSEGTKESRGQVMFNT